MIDIKNVTDLEIDGIDTKDAPKFCDAYFSYGVCKHCGKELTDSELDELTENYPETLNEMAIQDCVGRAEANYDRLTDR